MNKNNSTIWIVLAAVAGFLLYKKSATAAPGSVPTIGGVPLTQYTQQAQSSINGASSIITAAGGLVTSLGKLVSTGGGGTQPKTTVPSYDPWGAYTAADYTAQDNYDPYGGTMPSIGTGQDGVDVAG